MHTHLCMREGPALCKEDADVKVASNVHGGP